MHNNSIPPKNKTAGPVTCLTFIAIISGCAKPYIQTPEIVGEKPATLKLFEETLKTKGYGDRMFSIYKSEVECSGPGPAKKKIVNLGRFYDDTGFTGAKHTKIQIPTDSKVIVQAYYNLQKFFNPTTCDISIKFSPEPGASYLFMTKREQEAGVFAGAGKCEAAIFQQFQDSESGEEKLVEVSPVSYGSLQAFMNQRFFCDENGNALTEKEWEKRKSGHVDSLLYGDEERSQTK